MRAHYAFAGAGLLSLTAACAEAPPEAPVLVYQCSGAHDSVRVETSGHMARTFANSNKETNPEGHLHRLYGTTSYRRHLLENVIDDARSKCGPLQQELNLL